MFINQHSIIMPASRKRSRTGDAKRSRSRGPVRRRKLRVNRNPRPRLDSQVHQFSKVMATPLNFTNVSTSASIEPTLASLSGYTEITSLFDHYRITGWDIMFMNNRTMSDEATAGVMMPFMWIVNDQDGGGPTTEAAFFERGDAIVRRMDVPLTFKNRSPRISGAAYAGGAFTGYTVGAKGVWLDCASSAIPYYGTYLLQTNSTGANGNILVYVKVHFEAKGLL